MMRLPRYVSVVALACAVNSVPLASSAFADAPDIAAPAAAAPATAAPAAAPAADQGTTAAPATPAPTTPAPATAAPATNAPTAPAPEAAAPAPAPAAAAPADANAPAAPSKDLVDAVEDFWYSGKIARYDLQNQNAAKILAHSNEPLQVLMAFEDVLNKRNELSHMDEWLLRWQGVPQVKDNVTKITAVLQQGYEARRSDPKFIEQHIQRLSVNQRAYDLAIERLRQSGELAVPLMLQDLRDPAQTANRDAIRRALRDLGRLALNPLLAATNANDPDLQIEVIQALGDMGYDVASPYLARLAQDPKTSGAIKDASRRALAQLNTDPNTPAAGLFYQLGEKFYYDRAAVVSDTRGPQAFVWYWDNQKGLIKVNVPHEIFNEIMAMREAEYALELGGQGGDALSLWLASNYKREVELPQGQTDATRPENSPNAHYYGVAAGAQYLNAALNRALHDHNGAVALKVIKSLQEIAGQSNAFSGEAGAPLIAAMSYPDRQVRFEAAFAIAGAMPQQPFEGSQRVVPLLAEALAQTGQISVLVVAPSQDKVNTLVQGLKAAGYQATGSTSGEAILATANSMPAVDVILISEDLGAGPIDQLFAMAAQNPKLEGAARLVMTKTAASPYETRKASDLMLSTTQVQDPAAMKPPIEQALKKAGSLSMDPALATQFATRSAELLQKLAIAHGQVLDLTSARTALLGALNDARPEIVKLSGEVLGYLDVQDAQTGLLTKAADDKTADDVKISLFKSLASNAKFFGNKLDPNQVKTLQGVMETAANLDVRSAAAEAHGAANLPPDQAKTLILKQAKH